MRHAMRAPLWYVVRILFAILGIPQTERGFTRITTTITPPVRGKCFVFFKKLHLFYFFFFKFAAFCDPPRLFCRNAAARFEPRVYDATLTVVRINQRWASPRAKADRDCAETDLRIVYFCFKRPEKCVRYWSESRDFRIFHNGRSEDVIHRGACRNNNNNNSAAAAGTRRRLRNRRRRLGNSRAAVSVRSPPSYHHRRARLFRSRRRRRLFRLVDDKCVCVIRVFCVFVACDLFFWRFRQTIFSLSVVCDNPSSNVSDCRRPVGRTGGQEERILVFPRRKLTYTR
ncbi:hypothetical protein AGLY_006244 [Aphis glycines]|uniref:Uncharacterized protein n=1 Tax=Aphis glycines TaxID=307491 RepID=A0A6G0TSU3_APHGL|nr:hypothetical protein AGLY_006244 [Aphis glycines]